MEGQCQCGQITFTTPLAEPQKIFVCHCTECRHQSSSGYGITARFPWFEIPSPFEGAISCYTRPNSNGKTRCLFCATCGARLVHEKLTPDGRLKATVSIKGGCLNALSKEMLKSAVHIWTRSAVVDIPEGVESYEQEPPQ